MRIEKHGYWENNYCLPKSVKEQKNSKRRKKIARNFLKSIKVITEPQNRLEGTTGDYLSQQPHSDQVQLGGLCAVMFWVSPWMENPWGCTFSTDHHHGAKFPNV